MSPLYRVALLGFSAFERNALASYFRLAAHRVPRYEAAQVVSEADLMVADADHTPSVELVTAIERLDDTVFVGARPPSNARACLNRPIEPVAVMRELDALLAARGAPAPRAQDARRTRGPSEVPRRSEPAPDEGEETPSFDLKLRSEPAPIRSPAGPLAPRRAPDARPSRPGPLAAALTGLPSPLALPDFPPIVPPSAAPIYPPLAAQLDVPLPPAQAPTLTPTEDPDATQARRPPPAAVPQPPSVPTRPTATSPAPGAPTEAPAAAPASMSGPTIAPSIAAVSARPVAPAVAPLVAPAVAPSPTSSIASSAASSAAPAVEPPTLAPAAPPSMPAQARAPAESSTTAAPRPSTPASRVAAPWRPATAGAPSAPTMRALVVDDSEIAQRFLQKRLERFGLLIDCATNSQVALSLLTRHSYDFAFLDVELGESSRLDGLALCQSIKRHYSTRVPPITVVLVTAHVGELDRVRGTLAGCDAFLGKPLDEAGLDRLLARHGLVRRASTPSA